MTHRMTLMATFLLVAARPCGAQSPASSTAATSTTSSAAAVSEPSPEVVKMALHEGFKPKKRNGITLFCHTDANLGTRFPSEKCCDEAHMKMLVQQREDMRDQMRHPAGCSGCNGH